MLGGAPLIAENEGARQRPPEPSDHECTPHDAAQDFVFLGNLGAVPHCNDCRILSSRLHPHGRRGVVGGMGLWTGRVLWQRMLAQRGARPRSMLAHGSKQYSNGAH